MDHVFMSSKRMWIRKIPTLLIAQAITIQLRSSTITKSHQGQSVDPNIWRDLATRGWKKHPKLTSLTSRWQDDDKNDLYRFVASNGSSNRLRWMLKLIWRKKLKKMQYPLERLTHMPFFSRKLPCLMTPEGIGCMAQPLESETNQLCRWGNTALFNSLDHQPGGLGLHCVHNPQ